MWQNKVTGEVVKVLIACGKTGGHIFPGLSLAEQLKQRSSDIELIFIVTGTRLARRLLFARSYRLLTMPIEPMPYRFSIRYFKFLIKLMLAFGRSWSLLRKVKPDVVVGFGGAVSGPILLVAAWLRIPTLIHEQNVVPGRSNRILSSFVTKVATSFEETQRYFKAKVVALTGNPIRAEILGKKKLEVLGELGLSEGRFTVLVLGGSQGSHRINEVAFSAFARMGQDASSRLQVIHLTGVADFQMVRESYHGFEFGKVIFAYLDRIGLAYAASDLVVARAGASTISEVTSLGLPAILIPYPYGTGDQSANARLLNDAGAAILIEEGELSADRLKGCILELMADRIKLERMAACSRALGKPFASQRLADEVLKLEKGC